jgi:hypothetical protein
MKIESQSSHKKIDFKFRIGKLNSILPLRKLKSDPTWENQIRIVDVSKYQNSKFPVRNLNSRFRMGKSDSTFQICKLNHEFPFRNLSCIFLYENRISIFL